MISGTDPAIGETVTAADESPKPTFGSLARGETLGRYVILDRVGAGGMAVVYEAFDPQLDRRIALKVVAPSQASLEARERLQREAQAIARLNHPNVVTIHDVGTVEEQLFIAMELVDGGTLHEWLDEHERSWEEALPLLRRAGAGLMAAHAAGIVHRDFKPDNVLLSKSGQVKVADFGLARWASPDSAPSGPRFDSLTSSDASLTRTGAVMGTPAYMSPEQHEGAPGDERSDQFAFCVAVFESVCGKRPFAGRALVDIGLAKREGRLAEIPASVPGWIARAIRRGLQPDPDARWPSMQALLAALADDPRQRRRRWLGFGAVLAVGAGLGMAATRGTTPVVATCEDEAAELSALWNAGRTGLAEHFEQTTLPYAGDVARLVESELDVYTQQWTEQRREVCEQGRAATASNATLLARRECLGHARDAMGDLLELLSNAGPEAVADAPKMATRLPDLDACRPGALLELWEHLPDEPKARARAVGLIRDSEQLLQQSGLGSDARQRELEALRDEAIELEVRAVELAVRRRLAVLAHERGDIEEAARELEAVFWDALAHRRDGTALSAASELMWVHGVLLRHSELATRWHDASEAMQRRGGDDPRERAELHNEWGAVLYRQGRHEEAIAEFELAMQATPEATTLAQRLDLAVTEFNRASALLASGDREEGLAQLTRLEERYVGLVGPEHPALIDVHLNRSTVLRELGRVDEALELAQRALVMSETTANTQFQLASWLAVARAHTASGHTEDAVRAFIRARDLAVRRYPEGHVKVFRLSVGVIDQLIELDRIDDARRAIADTTWGEAGQGHRAWALALVARHTGALDEALVQVERALAILVDSDPLNMSSASGMRARLLAALGRKDEAKAAFETLLAEPEDLDPDELDALRTDYDALLELDALD